MEPSTPADTFSTRDAAKLLGVSVRTTQIWVEEGHLRAWKTPGGHRRILRDSIEAILRKRQWESVGSAEVFDILLVSSDALQDRTLQSRLLAVQRALHVRVARNGTEALLRIGEHRPQLLVADLDMPDAEGFQLLSTLGATAFKKPMQIVVITALDDHEIAERGGFPPGVALIQKPLNVAALLNLVMAYHDLWLLQRQNAR